MLQQQQHHIRIRRFIIIVLITLYFKLLTFISRCKGTAISTFSQSHIYGIRIPQLWYFEKNRQKTHGFLAVLRQKSLLLSPLLVLL